MQRVKKGYYQDGGEKMKAEIFFYTALGSTVVEVRVFDDGKLSELSILREAAHELEREIMRRERYNINRYPSR